MPHRLLTNAAHGGGSASTPTSEHFLDDHAGDSRFKSTFQNSYRLESKRPWVSERVLAVLKAAMHEHLDPVTEYDAAKCAELSIALADDVRAKVRLLNFERYKIACFVEICEKLFQGIHAEARFLWDPQRDHYVTYHLSNSRILASGTVFGVYYE